MLASAARPKVCFITHAGLELVVRESGGAIVMQFPAYDTQPAEAPAALLAALGIDAIENAVYNAETKILLLEITDPGKLAALQPDFTALVAAHDSINGVLVTSPAAAGDGYDFHSRYFWPWSGTNEDPVTGGTHTFLTGYWAERLGRTRLRSFQSSPRTGFMEVELVDGGLLIRGQAVIVFEGRLALPAAG
jgi:PhzF family phenazine biosynthesis protein